MSRKRALNCFFGEMKDRKSREVFDTLAEDFLQKCKKDDPLLCGTIPSTRTIPQTDPFPVVRDRVRHKLLDEYLLHISLKPKSCIFRAVFFEYSSYDLYYSDRY